MRIAIIGTGISGLVAAHALCRDHELTVFEAAGAIGGHTRTVDVERGGRTWQVDTGFIVFNHRTYPTFTRLLADLGVASQAAPMTFSVRDDRTGLEYGGASLDALFAQRRNLMRPRFYRMLADVLRFNRRAAALVHDAGGELTLGAHLRRERYGEAFVEQYLVPLGASIWSCPPGQLLEFPARFVARFLHNHGMLTVNDHPQWRVVTGGSRSYLAPLSRGFADRIRVATPVASVRRTPGAAVVTARGGPEERFDHVVLACHSDQALALLADPTDTERELLSAIPYQPNEVVLHTDASVLPRARRAWASWNYRVPARARDCVELTYDMNLLQGLDAPETFCVTVNDAGAIDPARVIRRIRYQHPRYTLRAPAAQRRHRELIDANRTSFCGAYWGFGFHEDGVQSGLAVARALGGAMRAAA